MTAEVLIMGLKRKYGRLAGELRQVRKQASALKHDMATIKAALKLFKDEGDVRLIKPVTPRAPGDGHERGDYTRTALDVLREAGEPISTTQIAQEVAKRCRLALDANTIRTVGYSVNDALRRREGSLVVSEGRNPKRWRVA